MCRAIVGCQSSYENIMSVDVTCHFLATMLSISPKQLNFYINKVSPTIIISTLSNLSTCKTPDLHKVDTHFRGSQTEYSAHTDCTLRSCSRISQTGSEELLLLTLRFDNLRYLVYI